MPEVINNKGKEQLIRNFEEVMSNLSAELSKPSLNDPIVETNMMAVKKCLEKLVKHCPDYVENVIVPKFQFALSETPEKKAMNKKILELMTHITEMFNSSKELKSKSADSPVIKNEVSTIAGTGMPLTSAIQKIPQNNGAAGDQKQSSGSSLAQTTAAGHHTLGFQKLTNANQSTEADDIQEIEPGTELAERIEGVSDAEPGEQIEGSRDAVPGEQIEGSSKFQL